MKVTTLGLRKMKQKGEKIASLTAYDCPTAQIVDEAGVDVIIVGDSASNVIHGQTTTLPVTMDEMLLHVRDVARVARRALVVGDMPFLSYQVTVEQAVDNAGRLMKAGAEAVKIEGGPAVVPVVTRLVELGIPVMGHLGLTPQSVHQLGGYRLQARTRPAARKLLADARALEGAGCFALVLEKVPLEVARTVSRALKIPTIGIGAGPFCDGQVLVLHDILSLPTRVDLRFVKRYADLGAVARSAVKRFCKDVRSGTFPDRDHSFSLTELRPRK